MLENAPPAWDIPLQPTASTRARPATHDSDSCAAHLPTRPDPLQQQSLHTTAQPEGSGSSDKEPARVVGDQGVASHVEDNGIYRLAKRQRLEAEAGRANIAGEGGVRDLEAEAVEGASLTYDTVGCICVNSEGTLLRNARSQCKTALPLPLP